MAFELAPELQRDCIELAQWPLSTVLLMNDSQFPWFILVPKVDGAREIIDLNEQQQQQFWQESKQLSELLMAVFTPEKLNVAALGNMVPQLHVHHIARFTHDVAWPKPVWGLHPAIPYTDEQLIELKKALAL
ncbi:HIT domain-containing protein [Pseudoalteromonas luteoviolacea]|uniref:Histidine triad (HIT) protein n=1 Tax=Pseudoalteromonas luteoviolacea H33 TaxID=1365251 RepID=A0A167EHP2_9GAMM|nr:HIT family protein [Pseudoalteromonas luteoviolacea]KZN50761.1 histidine triad (HIT) protein [Pseudoalteromonas luteoviolacea H33]KZN77705.1 histidine triad (HIT) protein [Pseudoalteromonas luteoviolacea H33-S]MBQ4877652.1 HIT family protein [Pseudoalteromonas luteoviolacea]MBQ4906687.1 HIT family protein [Pseudoalteromonas luteoviolacea]